MDRSDKRTDRNKQERGLYQVIRSDAWPNIEAAAGVILVDTAREYIQHLIYIASDKALAILSKEALDRNQLAKVRAVADAAKKLQAALRVLKAGWLQERLLDASEEVRAERSLARLNQGIAQPTLLAEIAEQPIPLTRDILTDVPAEIALAAHRLLETGKPGENKRARGLDKKVLERRLKAILHTLEAEQNSRANYSRFIAALWAALPADHPVRHLLPVARKTTKPTRGE